MIKYYKDYALILLGLIIALRLILIFILQDLSVIFYTFPYELKNWLLIITYSLCISYLGYCNIKEKPFSKQLEKFIIYGILMERLLFTFSSTGNIVVRSYYLPLFILFVVTLFSNKCKIKNELVIIFLNLILIGATKLIFNLVENL